MVQHKTVQHKTAQHKRAPRETAQPGYQTGFGNEFATEAVAGALPQGQNSPQTPPLGLYTEQHSGTSFTMPRSQNRRTWAYRIKPSVVHKPYSLLPQGMMRS